MFKMLQVMNDGKINADEFDSYLEMGALFSKMSEGTETVNGGKPTNQLLDKSYAAMYIRHNREWHLLKLNKQFSYKGGNHEFNPFFHYTDNPNESYFPHVEWDYEGEWDKGIKQYKVPVYNGTVDEDSGIQLVSTNYVTGSVIKTITTNDVGTALNQLMMRSHNRIRCSDLSMIRLFWTGNQLTIETPITTNKLANSLYSQLVEQLKMFYRDFNVQGRNTVFNT